MRSPRLGMAVTALSLLAAMSACSSDDSAGSADPTSSGSPSEASESATIYPLDACRARVKVTGALSAKWHGNAQATPSGETTLYQSSDGKKSWITATPEAGKTAAQVVVTVKGTTYNAETKGLRVEESDEGADVKAVVEVGKGTKATVAATFSCGQA